MSINVTLPSNGGGREFNSTNTNSVYKVRLPERLKLKDEDWEVALASISLPTFDAVRRSILHKFPEKTKIGFKSGLMAYEETEQPADPTTNPTKVVTIHGIVTIEDVVNGVVPVKDGYSFARNLVIQLHTKLNLARQTEVRKIISSGKSVYNPRWRHPDKQAYEQTIAFGLDEIRINGHYPNTTIFTAIHEDLAVAMGIIKAKSNATPGPSTLVAFRDNDYHKSDSWATFFKITGGTGENFLEMKSGVNWEIRGLNGGGFEKEFVNPTRTLRVYSNANTSSMVGNQVSDVLREVNFDSTKEGQQYSEPKHRQYLQVRQQEYEVMEIALDDLSGVPVKLGPRVTSVVLHFRHRNTDDV